MSHGGLSGPGKPRTLLLMLKASGHAHGDPTQILFIAAVPCVPRPHAFTLIYACEPS